MHRRLSLAITMLVVGASLLVAASFASASGGSSHAFKKGGIWRYGITGASVQVDTQLAYVTTAWWLEYATAAKLYNYPDKQGPAGSKLVPEVASKFTVSPNGKVYTFTIRPGFRFSDGAKVTAKNFKRAIDRTANKALGSPGATFITDANGTNIVGAAKVHNGQGTSVAGAVARGNKLIVRLTKADGTFMAKITMPFFQATSLKLPLTKEISSVTKTNMPSAGPYYMTRNDPDRLTQIRQNPFWKKGPGRNRPRNVAGVDVQWNLNEQTLFNQTLANQIDEDPAMPAAEVAGIAKKYGVNKSRFWSKSQNCTGYLPMNVSRSLFKGNTGLRKAINYAINRKDFVSQAGPYAGDTWTHIFNPGVPGWRNVSLYKQNLATAKKLAKGHFKSGKINVGYRSSGTINPAQAQIVRRDLIRLGFKPGNITMKPFSGTDIYTAMGKRGTDLDMGTSMGWCSDYSDPYDWLNVLLYGGAIQAENNNNYSYFNDPKWNKKLAAAARLVGPKRLKVYGQLDLDIMRQAAPMAIERTYNNRYLFSNRVNPKSLVYQGIYQDFSIAAMALK
ncbi:MAG TPA: ABC transporter substrate-binding protein [Gaiellaceae bacterium]|nr:ABC transporter substrate-binding protein [Gaiellaceae bacterium]